MEKSCPPEQRRTKGVHEYGAYLKRKCYREARSALVENAGVGSGTSIPRLQSGRANPRGRVHRPMR